MSYYVAIEILINKQKHLYVKWENTGFQLCETNSYMKRDWKGTGKAKICQDARRCYVHALKTLERS